MDVGPEPTYEEKIRVTPLAQGILVVIILSSSKAPMSLCM